MITLPGAPQAPTRPENQVRFPEGTHAAVVASIRATKTGKLIVEYQSPDGQFFYEDWLRSENDAKSKRTFAYVCRLHELAGLPAPSGSGFDEAALIGTACQITLIQNGEYLNLADFPVAGFAPGEEPAF